MRSIARASLICLLGCGGVDGPDDGKVPVTDVAETDVVQPDGQACSAALPELGDVASALIRPLSATEYDNALLVALDEYTAVASAALPPANPTPFDNDADELGASLVRLEAFEALAHDVATRLTSDPERLRGLLRGRGVADDAPALERLTAMIENRGSLLLRRPLSDAEVADFLSLAADEVSEATLPDVTERVLAALLLEPEFLFRLEVGTPVDDGSALAMLDPWEVLSRLSFFATGGPPTGEHGALASDCSLYDPAVRASVIADLASTEAGLEHAARFHGMWLGYSNQVSIEGASSLLRQADEMVGHVLREDLDWTELFTTSGTWMNSQLAEEYALSGDFSSAGWVDGVDPERRGLLSWGAFLSVGPPLLETSPTARGKLIAERLLCAPVPAPPATVMADGPPPFEAGTCKAERYAAHLVNPSCAGCHRALDGVGNGLEGYDVQGRRRFYERDPISYADLLDCPVDPLGQLEDLGTFTSPAELAELLLDDGRIGSCMVEHLLQFELGRKLELSDRARAEALWQAWEVSDGRWVDLLTSAASADAFVFRATDP